MVVIVFRLSRSKIKRRERRMSTIADKVLEGDWAGITTLAGNAAKLKC